MSNGDHFGAYGDPPTSEELRQREWEREMLKHKEWLENNIDYVERTLGKVLNLRTVSYIVKCLKGYRP